MLRHMRPIGRVARAAPAGHLSYCGARVRGSRMWKLAP